VKQFLKAAFLFFAARKIRCNGGTFSESERFGYGAAWQPV
jgi:hypothetical protein